MAELTSYRAYSLDSRVVVVGGSTLEDFALYFDLSRISENVYWFIPNWLTRRTDSEGRLRRDANLTRPLRDCATLFAEAIQNLALQKKATEIDFLSVINHLKT